MRGSDIWRCNVCGAANDVVDAACQFCECQGQGCERDNCDDPRHLEGRCCWCDERPVALLRDTHGTADPACRVHVTEYEHTYNVGADFFLPRAAAATAAEG